jgi:hypothetical protein
VRTPPTVSNLLRSTIVVNVCDRGPRRPTVDRAPSAWSCRRRQHVLSRVHRRPYPAMAHLAPPLAHQPDAFYPCMPQLPDAVIHLHAAYNAAWVGTMCTEINTPDCEGPFGVWGGPEEGEERGREASYREWSRVSEPCRCARLLPTHCYVKMTIW